jgi:hypothetical protein
MLDFRSENSSKGGIAYNGTNVSFTSGSNNIFNQAGISFDNGSNYLDDYEEGTFTPTFVSGASSWTYNFQNGRYTKIGNFCHFSLRMDAASVTSANSNIVTIGSLPFTIKSGQPEPSFSIGYNNAFQGSGDTITALGGNNSTVIYIYQDNGSALTGTEATFTNDLYISGSYRTA